MGKSQTDLIVEGVRSKGNDGWHEILFKWTQFKWFNLSDFGIIILLNWGKFHRQNIHVLIKRSKLFPYGVITHSFCKFAAPETNLRILNSKGSGLWLRINWHNKNILHMIQSLLPLIMRYFQLYDFHPNNCGAQ